MDFVRPRTHDHQPSEHGGQNRKDYNFRIDVNGRKAGHVGGQRQLGNRQHTVSQRQSGGCAHQAEHNAFGKKLANDATAVGSECGAEGHLLLTNGRTR